MMISRDMRLKIVPSFVAGALLATLWHFGTGPPSTREEVPATKRPQRVASASAHSSGIIVKEIPLNDYRALIEEAGTDPYQSAMKHVLLVEWAKRDPAGAVAFAKDSGNDDFLYIALEEYGKVDGVAALAWVTENIPDDHQFIYKSSSVVTGIAKVDPALAMDLVGQFPGGEQKNGLLSIAVEQWAKQDIRAVFEWMQGKEVSENLHGIYQSVMFSYLKQDPAGAVAVIESMHQSPLKATLSNHYATTAARTNPQQTIAWANKLSDPDSRKSALQGAVDSWLVQSPDDAFQYINSMANDVTQQALLNQVSIHLANADPAKLVELMEVMPEASRAFASSRAAQSWFAKDPAAAQRWLNELPEGGARQAATRAAVDHYSRNAPLKAFELALTTQGNLRYELASQTITQWSKIDAGAAEVAIINSPDLNEDEKVSLLEITRNEEPFDIVIPQN